MIYRLLFFVCCSALCHAQTDTLTFATYQYADNSRIKNIQPFATYIGKMLQRPVRVKSYRSVHELIAGMRAGETDVVFINTFGYLLLREQSNDFTVAAALRLPPHARSTYQTAIVANAKTGIRQLEDLLSNEKKFKLLLVNPGSTSGNLVPRLKLAEIGIGEPEKFFESVTYTKNHALTLKQVADGTGDFGAFGSEEYYKALAADSSYSKRVKLLFESSPIPLGPVLLYKSLSTPLKREITRALLALHEENPEALEAVKSGWTEAIPADRFHTVSDAYYNSIIAANPGEGMKIIKAFAQ